ncbi:MAG: hypothetical protein WCS52_01805 [bacterium]
MKIRTGNIKEKDVVRILETPWWPPMLSSDGRYYRPQDDCPPSEGSGIAVSIGCDGDAWVQTYQPMMQSCRYRVPMFGGGMSPRVRQALLILAMAIKLDNEENPVSYAKVPDGEGGRK